MALMTSQASRWLASPRSGSRGSTSCVAQLPPP